MKKQTISVVLSGWVVKPMEKGYEKQKEFISDAGHELDFYDCCKSGTSKT